MGIIVEIKNPVEDLGKKLKSYKRKFWMKTALVILTLLAATASTFFLLEMQTYSDVRVLQSYSTEESGSGAYCQYMDGILRYSRDGVAFLDYQGNEQWNQSCQIQTPFATINGETVVIADRGGNDILVFGADGLRGEIHTNYPVEAIAAAENGIVCALLRNGSTPELICYDAAGNVLVEQKASLSGTGYPLAMALSPDGMLLQVSYLCIEDGVEASRVCFYNFSEELAEESSQKVTEDVYKNTVISFLTFVDGEKSLAVGDGALYIYEGAGAPELTRTVELDKEIKSICHEDGRLGLVLKNSGETGYELRIYNENGNQTMSKEFSGEYGTVKMSQGDVIMYEGQSCMIYSNLGVRKFDGELNESIQEIIPLTGINKYLVMNANGIEEVRLVK